MNITNPEKYILLEEYIVDLLVEQQLKLGYIKETVRLYYQLKSLNSMFELQNDSREMMCFLTEFAEYEKNRIGKINITESNDRFCIAASGEVSEYVQELLKSSDSYSESKMNFLSSLINLLSEHGTDMKAVENLFARFSDDYVIEKSKDPEFDYLAYFTSGKPDAYRYCFVNEGCHIIYHRFSKCDYEDMYGKI